MKKFFMMFAAVIMALTFASCSKSNADKAAAAVEKVQTAINDKDADAYCAALGDIADCFTACKDADEFEAIGKAIEKMPAAEGDTFAAADQEKIAAAVAKMLKASVDAGTKFQKDAINEAKEAGGEEAEAAEALEDVVDEAAEEVEEAIDEAEEEVQ